MNESIATLLPHIVLLIAAAIVFIAGQLRLGQVTGVLAIFGILAAAGVLAVDFPSQAKQTAAVAQSNKADVEGSNYGPITKSVESTELAVGVQWTCLGIGWLFAIMGLGSERTGAKFSLLLLLIAGCMYLAVARDLLGLFVGVELTGLVAYQFLKLGSTEKTPKSEQNADGNAVRRYVFHDLFASALLLNGLALFFGLAGSTDLQLAQRILSVTYSPSNTDFAIGSASNLGVLAMLLIWTGLGAKIALVPFHLSTLDLAETNSSWNIGILTTLVKGSMILVLWKVVSQSMVGYRETAQLIGIVIALATMTMGNVLAFRETRLRPLLLHISIAHGGLILMALAAGIGANDNTIRLLLPWSGLTGNQSMMFHLLVYSLTMAGLIGVLSFATQRHTDLQFVDDLSGLLKTEPWAAILAICFLLSLAGFPPFPGFWSKFSIMTAALSVQLNSTPGILPTPHPAFVLLCLAALANFVLAAAVSFRLISVIAFDSPIAQPETSGGQPALAASMLAASVSLGFGILPGPIFWFLIDAVR
ncbi:MAG: hypothetical protein CMJ78_06310 [Planctomycetaceae bacterium]|nr:hypothetical protein [Planctomycetaceae bacterium]